MKWCGECTVKRVGLSFFCLERGPQSTGLELVRLGGCENVRWVLVG